MRRHCLSVSLRPSKDAKDAQRWSCRFQVPEATGVGRGRWGCFEARLEVGAVHKARHGREGGIDAPQVQDKMTSCVTVICNKPELDKVQEWEELRTTRTRYSDIDRIDGYVKS